MQLLTSNTSDKQSHGRNEILVLMFTRALRIAAGILHQGLLAYLLLPEGRGTYAICILITMLSIVIFTPGTGRSPQYFIMSKKINISQGVSVALFISLVGGAIAIICGTLLIVIGFNVLKNESNYVFFLALALIPIQSFSGAMVQLLNGLRRYTKLAIFFLIHSIVTIIAVIIFVKWLGWGINGAITALLFSNMVFISICTQDLVRKCRLIWEYPDISNITQSLSYGFRNWVSQIGIIADERLGSLLLAITSSRADIGFFSTSSIMMARILDISNAISTFAQPRVANSNNGRPELVAFCARMGWYTTGVALVILLAISEPLVRIAFSEAFLPMVHLIRILSIGIFIYSGAELFATYFRSINHPEICSWAVFVGVIINIAVFFLFFPIAGLNAAAWAMTAGLVTRSAFLLIVFCSDTKMSLIVVCLPKINDITYAFSEITLLLKRNKNAI